MSFDEKILWSHYNGVYNILIGPTRNIVDFSFRFENTPYFCCFTKDSENDVEFLKQILEQKMIQSFADHIFQKINQEGIQVGWNCFNFCSNHCNKISSTSFYNYNIDLNIYRLF